MVSVAAVPNVLVVRSNSPYKSLKDLLGGHVVMDFDGIATSLPHINNGPLRPLGVSSKDRVKALRDVPSIAETLPDFDVVAWYEIWAPTSTPAPIVERVNREMEFIKTTGIKSN